MASKYIKPTESELEILNILWQSDASTVRDVHEGLAKTKDVGYTTTLKLMQIMHEKGLVKRDESMRTHVYQPAVNRENTQKHLLDKMIDSLFGGSSTQLVLQALGGGEQKVSAEELDQIQTLLNNLKNQ
ncbi:MAG TPA: BlaI/MecI/CopY family transcriptional regulator [Flavisolibacter sp.]|jgi:predicted transcriptional regulator|nr:BlaI/MecI/CopY family transcriptional regulator [Flavisolibacter sp.]